jgi:hypothetical protein
VTAPWSWEVVGVWADCESVPAVLSLLPLLSSVELWVTAAVWFCTPMEMLTAAIPASATVAIAEVTLRTSREPLSRSLTLS